jgi:hypothetical protein
VVDVHVVHVVGRVHFRHLGPMLQIANYKSML